MKTINGTSFYENRIKKSRFIARASRADTTDAAMAFLDSVRDPDATHNCWAYKISDLYRFHDDGEPGGTAGRPIYMTIEQQKYDHVIVVVTRYFGGIKLGAGGLARAYGGTAGKCLEAAEPHIVRDYVVCKLNVPFDGTGIVYPLLEACPHVDRLEEQFTADGILFVLRVPADDYSVFSDNVKEAFSGQIHVEIIRLQRL